MQTKNKTSLANDQSGFASLIIAMVLILVLSLITVGFAQLMNKETRSALDKQLSSQAYYAAESGVNAATEALDQGYKTAKSSCGALAPGAGIPAVLTTNTVGDETGASYPCLLIDPAPKSLEYKPIDNAKSKVFQINGVANDGVTRTAIGSVTIGWQDHNGGKAFADGDKCSQTNNLLSSSTNIPPATDWNDGSGNNITGLLRVQILPFENLNRQALIDNTMTVFLCPHTGTDASHPNTISYSDATGYNGGKIIYGHCNLDLSSKNRYCTATIDGLPANQASFFMSLRSIYFPNDVTVTACSSGPCYGNNLLRIAGAQTLVDSTGKAQDVLKRIQVRIPSNNSYSVPDGTAVIGDLCKQLKVNGEGAQSDVPANCPNP